MKKNIIVLAALLSTAPTYLTSYTISAIFVDVEVIFQTNPMRASKYVGKIDSLRYLAEVGNLPNQEDLFKQLKPVKALSTQVTHNKGLAMPLILSDWLVAAQSSSKINATIEKYVNSKDISNIEKKVLLAIVSMMLTPNDLADTQSVSSKVENLLSALHRHGYTLFLIGNWANIGALKKNFSHIFKLFKGTYVSGDLHLLKPAAEFYSKVLELSGFGPDQSIWIETEQKFTSKMQQLGLNTILCHHSQHEDIIKGLQKYGIRI